MSTSIGIVALLCGWGLSWLKANDFGLDFQNLWALGFGVVSQYTLVISPNDLRNGSSLVMMVLLANLPQLALALIYFSYSAILTTMFIAADWSRFAFKPQTLMVSMPENKMQRLVWFLGIPLPFAILLIVMQVALHWLTSQSLFVAQIFRMGLDNVASSTPIILNCGFSPIAIVFSLVLAILMLVPVFLLMYRKFPQGSPPVVGTNSAAISAACHAKIMEYDLSLGPLRWGAWQSEDGEPLHCSLMPADVYDSNGIQPVEGMLCI
jgi:hypothetical protein